MTSFNSTSDDVTLNNQYTETSGDTPDIPENENNISQKPKKKKSKLKIGIILIIIASIIIGAVSVSAYYIRKSKYKENLSTAAALMIESSASAEETGNLLSSVWYNTIYKKSDSKTDKYTKNKRGRFNSDFNTSLSRLIEDKEFQEKKAEILDSKFQVTDYMKSLMNPPKGFEDAYKSIKALYDTYMKFIDLAVYPKGSYTYYSAQFTKLDNEILNNFNNLLLYVDFK